MGSVVMIQCAIVYKGASSSMRDALSSPSSLENEKKRPGDAYDVLQWIE